MSDLELTRYEKLFIAATRISAAIHDLEDKLWNEKGTWLEDFCPELEKEWENLTDALIGASDDPILQNRLPDLNDLTE